MQVSIYGCSDDLVYICTADGDGALDEEEICCYDTSVEVMIGDEKCGVGIAMAYGREGTWVASVAIVDECVPMPGPVSVSKGDGRGKWGAGPHSVIVEVECDDGTAIVATRDGETVYALNAAE